MKTLLVATDFSANANHAAEYAHYLAGQLKANLILCNAFIVPSEVPDAGLVTWPVLEYDELNEENSMELETLKGALLKKSVDNTFKPEIRCVNQTGPLTCVIDGLVGKEDIEIVIMGTHGHSGINTLLIGDHCREMIDEAKSPLLLVPSTASIAEPKKIAFATDFKNPEKDLEAIFKFTEFARSLNAELLVTHVTFEHWPELKARETLERFLVEISNKANYPNIYYRVVRSDKPEKGLKWLCGHGQVDMLAMVHRKHKLFEKVLFGSHTKRMADQIDIPLFVIPEKF